MDLAPVVKTRISADGRVWTLTASGAWDVIAFVVEPQGPAHAGLAAALDRAEALQASRRYTEAARAYAAVEPHVRWFDPYEMPAFAGVVLV